MSEFVAMQARRLRFEFADLPKPPIPGWEDGFYDWAVKAERFLTDHVDIRGDDPPEADPEDAEAQRIAETYADARAEVEAIEAGGEVCP